MTGPEEPPAWLPDRIDLRLDEAELVLQGLECLVLSSHPRMSEVVEIFERILRRLWGDLGDANDEGEDPAPW